MTSSGIQSGIESFTGCWILLSQALDKFYQDSSEADLDVLEHQLRSREPLREDEAQSAVTFRTDQMTVEDVRMRACALDTRLANQKEAQQ